jgi:hypothetical protein
LTDRSTDGQTGSAAEAAAPQASMPETSAPTPLPPGYAFLASVIHPYDPIVKANRNYLTRGYFDEALIQTFIEKIEGYTLVTYDGLCELANIVRYCETAGIPGDYVELGAYKGGCIAMMAMCNLHYGKERRRIHAFDSFEGLPQPVQQDLDPFFDSLYKIDDSQKKGELTAIKAVDAGEEFLQRIMAEVDYPKDKLLIHKGWFQDTVPPAAPSIPDIAVLRLDGDLYESYMVPLQHLYDRVVPGGFIIIDDWIFKGCREAIADFFGPRGGIPYMHLVDITVRVIRKPGTEGERTPGIKQSLRQLVSAARRRVEHEIGKRRGG